MRAKTTITVRTEEDFNAAMKEGYDEIIAQGDLAVKLAQREEKKNKVHKVAKRLGGKKVKERPQVQALENSKQILIEQQLKIGKGE